MKDKHCRMEGSNFLYFLCKNVSSLLLSQQHTSEAHHKAITRDLSDLNVLQHSPEMAPSPGDPEQRSRPCMKIWSDDFAVPSVYARRTRDTALSVQSQMRKITKKKLKSKSPNISLCSPGWPRTGCIEQAVLKCTEIDLSLPPRCWN